MSVEHVHALTRGVRLNQYELLDILGAGGFGITYMARDTTLDTMVAIKEYLPGDLAVRQENSHVMAKSSNSKGDFDWGMSRFLDEARVLAKFRHPHIVRVNQIFEANDTAYLVMEYAKGESLTAFLNRDGPLSEQQTKDILFPILDGLKRVHEMGFLHRDIKPDNIIIREEGGAVLIDFGAAREALETKSRAITSIVTEGYAPLEQYDPHGNQGAWTDIYALGGVAYKCLTGTKPPSATSRVRSDPLTPVSVAAKGRVSREFAAAIESSLNVFENLRPQSIGAFLDAISGKAPPPAAPDSDDATRIMRADSTPSLRPLSVKIETPTPVSTIVAPAPVAAPAPAAGGKMRSALFGVAAAAVLVAGAAGWFALHGAGAPPVAEATAPAAAPQAPAPAPVKAPAAKQASLHPNDGARAQAPAAAAQTPIAPAATPAFHTSFNCAAASNEGERLVCGDSQLAALDVRMAGLLKKALGAVVDTNPLNADQQVFVSERDACSEKSCLLTAYDERIKELLKWVDP